MQKLFNKKNIKNNTDFEQVITSDDFKLFNLSNFFQNINLIYLLVKRNFVVFYKQTILGPAWYILQPVISSIVFTFVFSNIAGIKTNGLPAFLFYLASNVSWGFFSASFVEISKTFVSNSNLFSKVYFPRTVIPISILITSLFQFTIQFLILVFFIIYYSFNGLEYKLSIYLFFLPLIILHISIISFSFGLIISSITARYRDLSLALPFLIQIWMFITPIVYPLSEVPKNIQQFIILNPMTAPVETFRNILFDPSSFNFNNYIISIIITLSFLFIGLFLFKKVEKNFLDTV